MTEMTATGSLLLVWCVCVAVSLAAGDDSLCPKGSQINLASLRCYWLSETSSSWSKAVGGCGHKEEGELATVSGPEDLIFIHSSFASKAGVWVWLRGEGGEGPKRREGLGAPSGPRGARSRESQRDCTQMALGTPGGQWRKAACDGEFLSLCDRRVTVSLPSLDSYLTGAPLMSAVYARSRLHPLPNAPDIGQLRVEMLLFPGLWFSHAGQVVSVELVVQPSQGSSQARVQILRPYCRPNQHLVPPGCDSLLNPFSCCSAEPLCNTTGGCARGQYWCPLLEACVPVTSPCSPYQHSPGPGDRSFHLPPRYPATPPFYHQVADVSLRVAPSSDPVHISVSLAEREVVVYPDDVLALQHTRSSGTFLHCRSNGSSPSSPWRQSYLVLQGPEWGGWREGGLSSPPEEDQWVDRAECDLRVLYVDTLHGHGYGSEQNELSGVTHTGTTSGPISSTLITTPAPALSPISGLRFVHPQPDENNRVHLPVHVPTLIVVKILSGQKASSFWSGPELQTGVAFHPSCPEELPPAWPGCERESPDTWFSHVSLVLPSVGEHTLNVSAVNGVSSQSAGLQVWVYEEVSGLSVEPSGQQRMLVDVSQLFTARVESGSSVKYTWVIDDLDTFSYEGDSYSVVFKIPAQYKLKVTAANPVSSQTLEVILTADVMAPLAHPEFISASEVVAMATTHLYGFRVKVDISLGVTFSWDFGEGSVPVNHTHPAPYESRGEELLGGGVRQVYVQDSVSHAYLLPDDYTLRVQVYSRYDSIDSTLTVKVRPPLTGLLVSSSPGTPLVNHTFLLEASAQPSLYGILYTWNFGDGSKDVQGFHGNVRHVVKSTGSYNMTVRAYNTLTALTAWVVVEVMEKVSGLQLSYNGPNELNSATEISGQVASGSSLAWSFDFGDGSGREVLTGSSVFHVYESPGNYTVTVSVSNSVSQASQSLSVEVYRLAISGILPLLECLVTGREIELTAQVNGNVSLLAFHWSFGDGSPVSVQKGKSTVTHIYSSPGMYNVNVTALGSVGSTFYNADVCTEAQISGLIVRPSQTAVAVGEEVCFNAIVDPKQLDNSQFTWFNHSSSDPRHCLVFKEDGIQEVTVTASNKVSSKIAKVIVTVQRPVTKLSVGNGGQNNALTVDTMTPFWISCMGTNVSVCWDFGDGSPLEQGHNVSHVFTSAGKFTVAATASNAVSRDSVTLEANVLLPVSDLALQVGQPYAVVGEETLIMAVTSVVANADYHWSVEGITAPEQGTYQFRYVFPREGVYQVRVVAQNLVSHREAAILIEAVERIQGLHIDSQSLTTRTYIPTRENVLLVATVTHGSNVVYHWSAKQRGLVLSSGDGELFQLFSEMPGNVTVEVTASNKLGDTTRNVSVTAVERVSGARITTKSDIVAVEKAVNISTTVDTGSDLQYLWYVTPYLSPIQTDRPFLLHKFKTLGPRTVVVSVRNALGSTNATIALTVEEEIGNVDFHVDRKTRPFFMTSNLPVSLDGFVRKGSNLRWEWKAFLTTGEPFVLGSNRSVIYAFTHVCVYKVSLNVSNGISWEAVSHRVTVQDSIQGLSLNISSSSVCSEDPIVFTPAISKGSDVSFSLSFNESDSADELTKGEFTTSTLPVGTHSVKVRAWNRVSRSQLASTVQVIQRIRGLRLVNCCSAVLEALREVRFQAEVASGSPTNYTWTIRMEDLQPVRASGQEVGYSPPGSGSLSVGVVAHNGVCSQALRETATAQWPVRGVKLACSSTEPFTGYPVTLSATIDGGSDPRFHWDFGDSADGVVTTDANAVPHTYRTAGEYRIQVTVFNNVSQVSTRLLVQVRDLQCLLPRVSIVQGQSTIPRSRPSYFEASVDTRGCTAYKTAYRWKMYEGTDCGSEDGEMETQRGGRTMQLGGQADVTTPLLFLPRHALEVGHYCLAFSSRLQGTPLHLTRRTRLSVVHSSLVAVIKGGSHRLWPGHSDLTLDGSDSHDPDVEPGEVDGQLQYQWNFITENRTESLSLSQPVGGSSSVLTVPSRHLQTGGVYLFTLTVHKEGRRPESTIQAVSICEAPVLPVAVGCVSCDALSSLRVSHSRSIVLSGRCDQCDNHAQYHWTAEDQTGLTLDLNEVTTSTGGHSLDLVVRPGVLQEGSTHTFTLNVTQPGSGRWGSASLTLRPNQPPHGGQCSLAPESDIRLLETVVTYNCSGWQDDDGESDQLIYSLRVAPCQPSGPACPQLTLYRGTQSTFGTLVPIGSPGGPERDRSVISVSLQVEDHLGAKVTALNRTLSVLRPVGGEVAREWLRNRSQTELRAVLQHGNPQELIPFSMALSSQLNQMVHGGSEQDLRDKREVRGRVTRALASLPISSVQDAAQISSALAQSTAVPGEVVCEGCQEKVLEAVGRMIQVMDEQTVPGDTTAVDTGMNILHVIDSSLAAVSVSPDSSSDSLDPPTDAAVSALAHAGALMRSLMRSRTRGEEPLSLSASHISTVGFHGDPSKLLCTDDHYTRQLKRSDQPASSSSSASPCHFLIHPSLADQLRRRSLEVVQILLGVEGGAAIKPLLAAAGNPISTMLVAMEFTTPQGRPIPIQDLDPDRAIRVTLPSTHPLGRPGPGVGAGARARDGSVGGDRSDGRPPVVNITLPAGGWVNFTVTAGDRLEVDAGLFIAFNFSLLPGAAPVSSGHVSIVIATQPDPPPASQNSLVRELTVSLSAASDALEETIFLSPLLNSTDRPLSVSLSSSGPLQASVCVFSSLCQYYDQREGRWSSEGLRPLGGSTLRAAHCLTQHLTTFGASLFVHPEAVVLLAPADGPVRNVMVGLVCAVLVLIHLLVGLVAHKLDHLEGLRLGQVPLCGRAGRYHYRVLVKTGWRRGAGTTAHVGVGLYGVTKSGARHLQREGAFQRSALDLFHLETDDYLGEVWKIRLWHDNTGLDPSWYVQHVVVWDPQTDHLFYFLVEDWLSVDNERNSTLEREVLASCPEELSQFRRVLSSQLLFGVMERHLWLSLWERPAHSRFTRGQRVTSCALALHLYLALGALWYGAVGTLGHSGPVSAYLLVTGETVAVGMVIAVLVFPVQCLLCFLFRKTHSQVPVDMSVPPSPVCQLVEMDVYLGQSDLTCPSFSSLPDSSGFDQATPSSLMESKAFDHDFWKEGGGGQGGGMGAWPSCDSLLDLPACSLGGVTPDPGEGPSLGAVPARLLKRKKALTQLRLHRGSSSPDSALSPAPRAAPDLSSSSSSSPGSSSFSSPTPPGQPLPSNTPPCDISGHAPGHNLQSSSFTLSEENLLRTIAADADVSPSPSTSDTSPSSSTPDSGRYSPWTAFLSYPQSGSSCSGWSGLGVAKPVLGAELHGTPPPSPSPSSLDGAGLYKSPSSLSLYSMASTLIPSPSPDSAATHSPTRIGVARSKPGRLLPPWVLCVIYPLVAVLLGACLAVVGLYGSHFSGTMVLMWLISAVSAFLTSALLLEPLKLCVQALVTAAVLRPVDPEVDERLGQEATVTPPGGEQGGKVRPLCGFGLLQAKEEARKVRTLRSLMRYCVGQLLFLLLVLLVNYQAGVEESQGRLLRSALTHSLLRTVPPAAPPRTPKLSSITGWAEAWQWIDHALVPRLYDDDSLHLVGLPRLRGAWGAGGGVTLSLGNSSERTSQILSDLHTTHRDAAPPRSVCVDFTHYHRETGLFVCVSVLLDGAPTHTLLHSLSIHPLLIPPSSSGLDLQVALMVLLLLSSLLLLSAELWAMATERAQYLRQGWRWLQLLMASLSLATAVLRLCFLSRATSCLRQYHALPDSFIDFHSAALLARRSSQMSAVLLTLLVLKLAGTLRFVRRWVVIGRVLRGSWRELGGVALLMALLLLLCAHTGCMLFSSSVEGFRSVRQAGVSVLCVLRAGLVQRRLSRAHPVLGPLYCLLLLGGALWLLAKLSGAVLIRTYRSVQAEMYRPAIEPQDYEMVEFFIKRLKLWMGLTKAREFRHRVKFEGMEAPPSRASQESRLSTLSSPLSSPRPPSSPSRPPSSSLSLRSEDSGVSEPGPPPAPPPLERLLPCVDALLARFDQVNQLTLDIQGLEEKLEEADSRRRRRRRRGDGGGGGGGGEEREEGCGTESAGCRAGERRRERRMDLPRPGPRISLPSCPPSFRPSVPLSSASAAHPSFLRTRSSNSESTLLPRTPSDAQPSPAVRPAHGCSVLGLGPGPPGGFPRRRAWHSGSSHSADAALRAQQVPGGGGGGGEGGGEGVGGEEGGVALTKARPRSVEGDRRSLGEGVPVKRRAWISEGPDTEED